MTLVNSAVRWTGDRSAIFPRVEMLTYVIGFFYFYVELMRLELQMIQPNEYKLSKFVL